eukprot:3268031-Pyramimonas_sp.AAC.1
MLLFLWHIAAFQQELGRESPQSAALLSYCATELLCYCATELLRYRATVLLSYCASEFLSF